jgi:hypothetical protein
MNCSYFGLMKPENRGKHPDTGLLTNKMFDANKELTLFGSDEVVTLYLNWFQELRQGYLNLERLGELVVAIRRDMGHPKTNLTAETVLRHLITDYDAAEATGERTHVPLTACSSRSSVSSGTSAATGGLAVQGKHRSGEAHSCRGTIRNGAAARPRSDPTPGQMPPSPSSYLLVYCAALTSAIPSSHRRIPSSSVPCTPAMAEAPRRAIARAAAEDGAGRITSLD